MTENIKKLLELATDKRELQDRLNKANQEELIAIARENGIALTDADFAQSSEISDDELGSVAGGSHTDCSCFMGGGGTGGGKDGVCACVGVGWGNCKDGSRRCNCGLCGAGYDTD